jgi:hypothetical protein
MPCQFRHIISGLLPVAATLSLVVGPSPSAVSAGYIHKADEESKHRTDGGARKGTSAPTSDPDDSRGDRLDTFVAPAAAKPAETKSTADIPCIASAEPVGDVHRVVAFHAGDSVDCTAAGLHCPAYFATAPPRR